MDDLLDQVSTPLRRAYLAALAGDEPYHTHAALIIRTVGGAAMLRAGTVLVELLTEQRKAGMPLEPEGAFAILTPLDAEIVDALAACCDICEGHEEDDIVKIVILAASHVAACIIAGDKARLAMVAQYYAHLPLPSSASLIAAADQRGQRGAAKKAAEAN